MSEANWYFATNGQQSPTPVAFENLQRMAASGHLQPSDMVWTTGMAEWAPASTIDGIFAAAPAPMYAGAPAYGQPGMLGYQTPRGVTDFQYAGFWLRFAAWLIDWIIGLVLGFAIGMVVGFVGVIIGGNSKQTATLINAFAQIASLAVGWLYYALQESSSAQATVGKRAVGIRVVDMEGQRISFGRATGRYFGKIISGIILGVGFMMAGFTEKKQALHDTMASTLVIKN